MADLAAAQAQYLRDREASPTGFLRNVPSTRDGFDMQTNTFMETLLRVEFGEWEDTKGLENDEDLAVLRSLHLKGPELFREMANTFTQVAADDDPSLNADGRLKIAVRILEPKLERLAATAERELARVDAAIQSEEAAIAKAVRIADPIDIAAHSDIRNYFRGLSGSLAAAAAHQAINAGDVQTMQAIASAPAYMTGLVVSGEPHSAYLAVQRALQERMAPERTRRLDALRLGKVRAIQSLATLDRKANRFIDFKRGRALIERETKRSASA